MKFNINGVEVETSDPAEIAQIGEMLGWEKPAKPKTAVEKAAEALAVNGNNGGSVEPKILTEAKARYPEAFEAQVMPEPARTAVAVLERPVEPERPVTPAVLPKKVELPPQAYVTQAQMLVVEMLRHYPEGLQTKQIASKLRWDGPKASRITTYMARNESGALHPFVEKVPGHRKYRLTEYGRRCRFVVVGNPSNYRVLR